MAIAVITIAGLFALSFVMQAGRAGVQASNAANGATAPLPGPALTLSPTTPATFVGRTPGTAKEVLDFKAQWVEQEAKALGVFPGASAVHAEVYGPGPKGAPKRGNGLVAIAWASIPTQFAMEPAMNAVTRAFTSRTGAVRGPVVEPSGAQIACGTSSAPAFTVCQWIRSGTGVIVVLEYGTDPAVVQADTSALAAQLTAP